MWTLGETVLLNPISPLKTGLPGSQIGVGGPPFPWVLDSWLVGKNPTPTDIPAQLLVKLEVPPWHDTIIQKWYHHIGIIRGDTCFWTKTLWVDIKIYHRVLSLNQTVSPDIPEVMMVISRWHHHIRIRTSGFTESHAMSLQIRNSHWWYKRTCQLYLATPLPLGTSHEASSIIPFSISFSLL